MKRQKTKPKKKQLPVNLPALPLLPAYLPLHASHSKKKLFFLAVFNQMDELTRESNRPDKSQTFKCFHFTRISEFIGKITNSDWLIFLHFYWSIFRAGTPYCIRYCIRTRQPATQCNGLCSHGNVKHAEYMLINKPIHTPLIHHPYRLPLRIDYRTSAGP